MPKTNRRLGQCEPAEGFAWKTNQGANYCRYKDIESIALSANDALVLVCFDGERINTRCPWDTHTEAFFSNRLRPILRQTHADD